MKRMLLAIGAVVALAVGLIAVTGAGAQEGIGPGSRVGDFVTRLSARLGISEDELAAAVKDVEIDMVNEGVEEGRLTEEQGAAMIEKIENGPVHFPGNGRHQRPCRAQAFVIEAVAEVLDMEVGQVEGKLNAGMSLAEIAEEQDMTVEDFTAALTDEVEAGLQAKVDAGRITQAQMDRLLEGFTSHVDRMINFHPEPGFPGQCHGHRPPANGDPAPQS